MTLPYAIAEAEQNFLSPKREQALIWADLVPQLIAGRYYQSLARYVSRAVAVGGSEY